MSCCECRASGLGPEKDFGDFDSGDEAEETADDQGGTKNEIPGRNACLNYGKSRPTKQFVEAAPSHDGKPCFASWIVPYPVWEKPDDDDKPPVNKRPLFGIRIYDVTPEANADRAKELATKLAALV